MCVATAGEDEKQPHSSRFAIEEFIRSSILMKLTNIVRLVCIAMVFLPSGASTSTRWTTAFMNWFQTIEKRAIEMIGRRAELFDVSILILSYSFIFVLV